MLLSSKTTKILIFVNIVRNNQLRQTFRNIHRFNYIQKKRGQLTLSTDEVLAYPKERYANRPRRIHSADINFATILPFDLTAKFDKDKTLPEQNAPIR